jgi:sulfur carrier protein ThiS
MDRKEILSENEPMYLTINITREKRTEKVEVDDQCTLTDLIMNMGQSPDGVIMLSDGIPIPLDTRMIDLPSHEMDLISVASGG